MVRHGLGWVTPHTMRHTFASLPACANCSLYKIAKWMGDGPEVSGRTPPTSQAFRNALSWTMCDEEVSGSRSTPKPETSSACAFNVLYRDLHDEVVANSVADELIALPSSAATKRSKHSRIWMSSSRQTCHACAYLGSVRRM